MANQKNPGQSDSRSGVAFQGIPGAYSHQACQEMFPEMEPYPCASFEEAIETVRAGEAGRAMLPVDNSLYGRIADIHHLLPKSGLHIVAEHFLPVRLNLLGAKGSNLEGIRTATSHPVALGQCRQFLREHRIVPQAGADTAGAARAVAEAADPSVAAIGSSLAAEIYGLDTLATGIEDAPHNTTRFLVMASERIEAGHGTADTVTSFVFAVRNVPAALYKALGGFATNGVNMVKLESYMVGGSFTATEFYADIEGHPEDRMVRLALEELGFFTSRMKILGVYPAHPYRKKANG